MWCLFVNSGLGLVVGHLHFKCAAHPFWANFTLTKPSQIPQYPLPNTKAKGTGLRKLHPYKAFTNTAIPITQYQDWDIGLDKIYENGTTLPPLP
jgi:hypothetical protein